MKQLLLQPVDTFFFRNHKDFASGENSTATTVFPPRPGTIYGALRSAYIHQVSDFKIFAAGTDLALKDWMGTTTGPGRFALRGCLMYVNNQILLPLPLDYQVIKGNEEKEELAYPLVLYRDSILASDGKEYRLYGVKEEKSSSSAGAFVGLNEWIQEIINRKELKIRRSSYFIESEDKLGIARDWETKTAIEHMVYQTTMSRFKTMESNERSGVVVLCSEAPDFQNVLYLRLGGKNRPWNLQYLKGDFQLFSPTEEEQIIKQIEESGIARLILLSPAVWTEQSAYYLRGKGRFRVNQELEFPILTEAMGRPTLIGGWDIARNAPKPRMQAVPAGTALYLEVAKEQARKLVMALKNAVLSDELGYEGYGWAVCGAGAKYKEL